MEKLGNFFWISDLITSKDPPTHFLGMETSHGELCHYRDFTENRKVTISFLQLNGALCVNDILVRHLRYYKKYIRAGRTSNNLFLLLITKEQECHVNSQYRIHTRQMIFHLLLHNQSLTT